MKNRFLAILFLSFLLIISSVSALAKEGGDSSKSDSSKVETKDSDGDQRGSGKLEVKNEKPEFDQNDVNELEAGDNEDEFEIKIEATPKIEIKDNKFETTGVISSISGNSFVVGDQTITIDISQVKKFEQKGILTVGKTVKVEGVIVNGTKFAKEIKVFEIGGQEVKIEIKNTPNQVKIEAKGPIDQIIFFFKQILGIQVTPSNP